MDYPHYLEQLGYAERTHQAYLMDIHKFALWFQQTNGDELRPDRLTQTDAKEYRAHLLTVERASPATINRKLAAIKNYIRWGMETGQIDYDPTARVSGVREQPAAPKWLERRELARLQRELERRRLAAKTPPALWQAIRDQAIFDFLENSGLRISELCELELGDLTLGERSGQVQVRNGKGGKARTVPLNNTARQAVKLWLSERPQAENKIVFLARNGQPLQPRAVQRDLQGLGKLTGIELTPHTLRHTFAKSLVDAGVSLEKVATLLGHSSLETTRIYTTPGQQDLIRAVEQLDN